MATQGLRWGPIGPNAVHLCVDMQRLFEPGAPWAVPWMEKVVPRIEALAERSGPQTVFTRFIPADRAGDGVGMWRRYYQRWTEVTLDRLEPSLIELLPQFERFVPPARVVDKRVYSPWTEGRLDRLLLNANVDTLVVTGGETDLCVLATALGAVDRGYRLILVVDALCSSSDETHEALMTLYRSRFSEQVELAETEEILGAWRAG